MNRGHSAECGGQPAGSGCICGVGFASHCDRAAVDLAAKLGLRGDDVDGLEAIHDALISVWDAATGEPPAALKHFKSFPGGTRMNEENEAEGPAAGKPEPLCVCGCIRPIHAHGMNCDGCTCTMYVPVACVGNCPGCPSCWPMP